MELYSARCTLRSILCKQTQIQIFSPLLINVDFGLKLFSILSRGPQVFESRIPSGLVLDATLCITHFFSHAHSIASVASDSLRPYGLQPVRLLCPWDFPGKNTGVGCHFLLQGIFLTEGSNPCLLHWQPISSLLIYRGSKKLSHDILMSPHN